MKRKTALEKSLNKISNSISFHAFWHSMYRVEERISELREIYDYINSDYYNEEDMGVSKTEAVDVFNNYKDKAFATFDKSLGFYLIHMLADDERVTAVKDMLAMGADVNTVTNPVSECVAVEDMNRHCRLVGLTPLHLAAKNHDIDMCKLLCESGADKSIKNRTGRTAQDMTSDKKLKTALTPNCETGKDFRWHKYICSEA